MYASHHYFSTVSTKSIAAAASKPVHQPLENSRGEASASNPAVVLGGCCQHNERDDSSDGCWCFV